MRAGTALCLVCTGALCLAEAGAVSAAKPFLMTVERNMTCGDGNVNGRLLIDGKEIARTLEPGPPGNRIPTGAYDASIRSDGKLGWRLELNNVPGWTNAQIHLGNFPSDTKGCILVGLGVESGIDKNTKRVTCAVTSSSGALVAIQRAMQAASDDGVASAPLAIRIVIH